MDGSGVPPPLGEVSNWRREAGSVDSSAGRVGLPSRARMLMMLLLLLLPARSLPGCRLKLMWAAASWADDLIPPTHAKPPIPTGRDGWCVCVCVRVMKVVGDG